MTVDTERWARYLIDAVDQRREVAAITSLVNGFGVRDAYEVQREVLAARLAAGDRVAGAKLGLTSKAKQEQMGVVEPAYGWLLASSVHGAGSELDVAELVHPRVEPEFVFVMGEDLAGEDVTADDVLDATERVAGGIEVIDSRYERFKFSLVDVIADNTSAARVVVGADGVAPREVDLATVTCSFEIDGVEVASADGSALLGQPAHCVALLVRHLTRLGGKLEAGWTVLAGAPTDAHALHPGSVVTARYSHFPAVAFRAV